MTDTEVLDKDRRVMLIGGTGSVGSIVVDELIRLGFTNIQVLARDEAKHKHYDESHGFLFCAIIYS